MVGTDDSPHCGLIKSYQIFIVHRHSHPVIPMPFITSPPSAQSLCAHTSSSGGSIFHQSCLYPKHVFFPSVFACQFLPFKATKMGSFLGTVPTISELFKGLRKYLSKQRKNVTSLKQENKMKNENYYFNGMSRICTIMSISYLQFNLCIVFFNAECGYI